MASWASDEVIYNDADRPAAEKFYKMTRHRAIKRRVWLRKFLSKVPQLRVLQICAGFNSALDSAYCTAFDERSGADPIQYVMDWMHGCLHYLGGVAKWDDGAEQWGYVYYTHAIRAMCFVYAKLVTRRGKKRGRSL
jgi:hypothetical protein